MLRKRKSGALIRGVHVYKPHISLEYGWYIRMKRNNVSFCGECNYAINGICKLEADCFSWSTTKFIYVPC